MRVEYIESAPWIELPCVMPTARGGRQRTTFPIVRAKASGLPKQLEALVFASDLQAREDAESNRALGVIAAETLAKKLSIQKIHAQRVGVILAGDLYTSKTLHRRFGVGDVSDVWDAFSDRFRWVTGVLGNVDRLPRRARKCHHLLEGSSIELDGLKIAGVSGIIGSAKMENRRPEAEVLRELHKVLHSEPEILVLHEGPSIPGENCRGNDAIRQALRGFGGLVVCGHNTWPQPLQSLRRACVVNADSRVIVLTRSL